MDQVTFFFAGWAPVARIVVVGTLGYCALVLLLRLSGNRTLAQMNAFDFIITVALGASFGRILTAHAIPLAEAVAAFALLVVLQFVMTSLQVRYPGFARRIAAPPALLFFRGDFLREAMRRERVTEADLNSAIREQGAGSFDQVEAVVLEANGSFAVVKKTEAGDGASLRDLG